MNILEKITLMNPDLIGIQFLAECATNYTQKKSGVTAITFETRETNPTQVFSSDPNRSICVLVWVPLSEIQRVKSL